MTRLRNDYLLMRHGHSLANEAGLIISDPAVGVPGYGLSEQGHAQLRQVLAAWHWPVPDLILHSDFLRTSETAQHVAEHFSLPMTADSGLRERNFGAYEGKSDRHYHEVWALDEMELAGMPDPAARQLLPVNRVETVESVAQRLLQVIERLEGLNEGAVILLVSHGDPLQILLTALAHEPLSRHRQQEPLLPAGIRALRRT